METINRIIAWFNNSIGVKLVVIAILALLLMIPNAMIMDLIREREQRRNETINEVTEIWGREQTICGPVLTVPYRSGGSDENFPGNSNLHYAHFLPTSLHVEGEIIPEVRYRGIFKVIIYQAKLHFSGNFNDIDYSGLQFGQDDIAGEKLWLEIGIPDMRGINREIVFTWNDEDYAGLPGLASNALADAGMHAEIPVLIKGSNDFSFDVNINGSNALNFIPLGKNSSFSLFSDWISPSFTGAFLPDTREVNESGFEAEWNILYLNRNYPQQWKDNQYNVEESSFGVELIIPVDNYQKSMRSVKYAILFIALTFLVFLFAEIINKTRIHPVHYLLTGLSLSVFYSLLTALSEHIPFNLAYLAGSVTIILMIVLYTHSIYRKKRVTVAVALSLIVLYCFLFVLLQLTDYALLIGNIGLVLILAVVMFYARKINYYESSFSGVDKEENHNNQS